MCMNRHLHSNVQTCTYPLILCTYMYTCSYPGTTLHLSQAELWSASPPSCVQIETLSSSFFSSTGLTLPVTLQNSSANQYGYLCLHIN